MRYFFLLFVVSTSSLADTRSEVVFDCDKARTNPTTCTACNIYHEARGEPIAGQVAVALVTKNRVEAGIYPNKYCDVVWEARRDNRTQRLIPMFSWTRDGKHDKVFNKPRWNMALKIANQVILKDVHDFTVGSLWYHTMAVDPYWKKHYRPTVLIGAHQFYTVDDEMFLHHLVEDALPAHLVADLRELNSVEN